MADAQLLPHGRSRAGDRHLKFYETRDNLHNVVGVGDAENDHAFLAACECAVAVANALPALATRCDVVTAADHGAGVAELVEQLITDDLAAFRPGLRRHAIRLGTSRDGSPVAVTPYSPPLLIAGTSGGGKSTIAAGLLERAADNGYQFCIVDPEGEYEQFAGAVTLGDHRHPPSVDEALRVLADPREHIVLNLLALPLEERPEYCQAFQTHLRELRARTGRPHWLLADEAHHLLPEIRQGVALSSEEVSGGLILLTVHPGRLARSVLAAVDMAVVVADGAQETITELAEALEEPTPDLPDVHGADAVVWRPRSGHRAEMLNALPGRAARHRHRRKYAQGELGPDKSFWFTGPQNALHLRAQNLIMFLQIGEGVDDATWLHHLRAGDYSQWIRAAIRDDELADEVALVEGADGLTTQESRSQIRAAVEARYTRPA